MANKLEQIALKKKQAEADAREAEITALSKKIASEVVSNLSSLDKVESTLLEGIIAGLSKSVSEAVVLSGEAYDKKLNDSFTQLLNAVSNNKPEKFDNSSNEKLFAKIGTALASLDSTLDSLELSPEIKLTSITKDELKKEVDRILNKLPADSKRSVTIAYENAPSNRYINVRLTDGINFYKAFGGRGGGGGSSSPTVDTGDGVLAVPVANPDGTPLSTGGASGGRWATYADARQDLAGDPMYFGKEDLDGNWVIKQFGITSNTTLYYEGTGGIDGAWDDRATYDYVEYNELT